MAACISGWSSRLTDLSTEVNTAFMGECPQHRFKTPMKHGGITVKKSAHDSKLQSGQREIFVDLSKKSFQTRKLIHRHEGLPCSKKNLFARIALKINPFSQGLQERVKKLMNAAIAAVTVTLCL
jgi:hypothetical protein